MAAAAGPAGPRQHGGTDGIERRARAQRRPRIAKPAFGCLAFAEAFDQGHRLSQPAGGKTHFGPRQDGFRFVARNLADTAQRDQALDFGQGLVQPVRVLGRSRALQDRLRKRRKARLQCGLVDQAGIRGRIERRQQIGNVIVVFCQGRQRVQGIAIGRTRGHRCAQLAQGQQHGAAAEGALVGARELAFEACQALAQGGELGRQRTGLVAQGIALGGEARRHRRQGIGGGRLGAPGEQGLQHRQA